MVRKSLFGAFKRRYVLLPMAAAVLFLIGAYVYMEERRQEGTALSLQIRDRQDRLRLLAELIYANADAESSQRGFLLTGDEQYLEPFFGVEARAGDIMTHLKERYAQRDGFELPALNSAEHLMREKFREMHATIELVKQKQDARQALALVHTGLGLQWMRAIRENLEGVRDRERDRVYADIARWEFLIAGNRVINRFITAILILEMFAVGILVIRDAERRTKANALLETQVRHRTEEVTAFSTRARRAIEEERAHLARELHDELGGILVGIKMDMAVLARRIDVTAPDVARRWQSMQNALNSGVELKRRVIEELRPTLLDNLGLVAAIRWQAEQVCQRANLKLALDTPVDEVNPDPSTAIELYRILQESLTNVVKHAKASAVSIWLTVNPDELTLIVQDDGVGVPEDRLVQAGSLGLLSMKYRSMAIGGAFDVERVEPHGTRVLVRAPLRGVG